MLKYNKAEIGLQEIPNEVSLVISISNCPYRCKACNSKELWDDIGESLSEDTLSMLIDSTILEGITCVLFMGGDIAPDEVNRLASYVRSQYSELKIGWYSGSKTTSVFIEYKNFDYLKFGPFIKKFGPLSSPKTNQRLYKVTDGGLKDITQLFR